MPNQPRRNAQGCPGLIYRIDFRSPEEIFENGFQPWGNNRNFFEHILGRSLGDEIPEERRSGIISASDSPDSSLRFFGGMLNEPEDPLEYYLYEIRADENVYSAERTASFYQQRINTGLIEFTEGDLETAIDAVDAIFDDFAYQREWFNVGPIPRERVRAAWRVDSVPILPNHIRYQRSTVYYTPRINDPEILNQHYVDANTYANNLPYSEGATLITPSTVSIPNEIVESDATGGVSASLGFACSLTPDSPHRSPRDATQKLNCYFDTKKVKIELNKEQELKPIIFSDVLPSKLFLRGEKTKQEFLLSGEIKDNKCLSKIIDSKNIAKAPNFIYDCFQCLIWRHVRKEFAFALTPVKIGDIQTYYEVEYTVATINDQWQKWKFEIVKSTNKECTIRIRSIQLPDFCLKREIATNKLFVRPIDEKDDNFEELHILITDLKCDTCILLPQEPPNKLVDITLSWFYKNVNYFPIPETNSSHAMRPEHGWFYYDLKTYKIIYIKKNRNWEISALYNNRNWHNWNWIRWTPSDLEKTNDKKYKWYFENQNWESSYDLNLRNIRSFWKNDYLRVVVNGENWGSFYTTNYPTDIRSIALFRIDPLANI